jgi:hypothetical protein
LSGGRLSPERREWDQTSEPFNPYQAPREAPPAAAPAAGLSPNLEDAIAGRYQLTIGEVMGEAWQLVKGMKGTLWGAMIVTSR